MKSRFDSWEESHVMETGFCPLCIYVVVIVLRIYMYFLYVYTGQKHHYLTSLRCTPDTSLAANVSFTSSHLGYRSLFVHCCLVESTLTEIFLGDTHTNSFDSG